MPDPCGAPLAQFLHLGGSDRESTGQAAPEQQRPLAAAAALSWRPESRSTCHKPAYQAGNSQPHFLPAALPAAAGALLPLACRLPGILPRDRGFRQSSKPRILDRLLFLPAFPSRGPWVSVEPVTQQMA